MELDGRVAIVTGGAVRLGKALALALAEEGVRLAVHYRSSTGPADATVDEIRALGSDAVALRADLSQPDQIPSVIEQAAEQWGRLDILVNSAAIFEPADLAHTSVESWDRHFAINLRAPFFLSQAFAAHVGKNRRAPDDARGRAPDDARGQAPDGARGRAHIVNIADWRGLRPDTSYLAYSLAKAGVLALTQGLALALAPNIQVNAIAPGAILPPPGKDQAYLDRLAADIPVQRVGSPAEIARTLVFLLKSDFVTGETVFVTGGQHLV
jgi:pteridine reductase